MVRDQKLSTGHCCGEAKFEFINESPARGAQPSQRFSVRSHVMKRYKRNQKTLRQNNVASEVSKAVRQIIPLSAHSDPTDEDGWEEYDHVQAQARPVSPKGSELARGAKARYSSNGLNQPRAFHVPVKSIHRKNVRILSKRERTPEVERSCCPHCGAIQVRIDQSREYRQQAIDKDAVATFVAWQRSLTSSPVQSLGAGRVDPFGACPDEQPNSHLHELMDHSQIQRFPNGARKERSISLFSLVAAITYLIPGLVPNTTNSTVHPISKAWLSGGLQHPLLFHALVFAGSIHLDFLRSSQIYPNKPLSLSHKLKVIRKINECLSDPGVESRDEVILAILILASHEAINRSAGKQNPFNSPLKNTQWLNIYSTISYVPEHMKAVLHFVSLRGGLEDIKMPGLAEVIAAGDIISASNSLSQPFCPLLRSSDAWLDYVETWATSSPRPLDQELASGFIGLQGYGISADIFKVLKRMGAVTMAIDHHLRGEPEGLNLGAIAKVRTAVHHQTLSLPLSIELEDGPEFRSYVYEAFRMTALIYGMAVIFPIANAYNLLQDLVRRLKASLTNIEFESRQDDLSGLYLWMLVLGGIAAADGLDREWFVAELGVFVVRLKVYESKSVEQIMCSFLWLESACGPGARLLWSEVMNSIRRK